MLTVRLHHPQAPAPHFQIHRLELGLLCKSAWQAPREMFQKVASDPSAVPGVVITVQYTTLGVDPNNADVVYVGDEGWYRSTGGGKSFTGRAGT